MNAVTIRRMIVFGVCSLGVAALYLVPSVAGSPSPMAMPRTAEDPQPRTSGRATVRMPQAGATGVVATAVGQPVDVTQRPAEPTQAATEQPEPVTEPTRTAARPTEKGRTAFDPADAPDSEPPAAVTTISPAKVTPDELGLSWPAATDDRRVIGYRIWLNGYEVATTAETRATLRWFNDDEGQHVVQIKAIDAAGNQSAVWSTLLITRPSAEPTETPQPEVTPTPTPTPTPTESPSLRPESQPTVSATRPPTRQPRPDPTASDQ